MPVLLHPHQECEMVRNCFQYEPLTGRLRRKNTVTDTGKRMDALPGITDAKGYMVMTWRGNQTKLHQLIWIWNNGPIPEGYVIHHRNEKKADNRIWNLQLMTPSEHMTHHQRKWRLQKEPMWV